MKNQAVKKMIHFLALAVMSLGAFRVSAECLRPFKNHKIIESSLKSALRLSGKKLNTELELPKIFLVNEDELSKYVCPRTPEECRHVRAIFFSSRNHIYLHESIVETGSQINRDLLASLVHEWVHVFQYQVQGSKIYESCASIRQAEYEAYKVEDKYRSQFGRNPHMAKQHLMRFRCDDENREDEQPEKNLKILECQ